MTESHPTTPDREPPHGDPLGDEAHGDDPETLAGELADELSGTGVGTEDPNIVGDTEPGPVDDEISDDTHDAV